MSTERDVQDILDGSIPVGSVPVTPIEDSKFVILATVEVKTLQDASGTTLLAICQDIERSSTKKALGSAFKTLNSFTRIFTESDPHGLYNDLVRDALIFSALVSAWKLYCLRFLRYT